MRILQDLVEDHQCVHREEEPVGADVLRASLDEFCDRLVDYIVILMDVTVLPEGH